MRSGEPKRRLFLLNRLSRTNFAVDVGASTELEARPPYLMFRNSDAPSEGVHGVWFPAEPELQAFRAVLEDAVRAARAEVSSATVSLPATGMDAGAALLGLLTSGGTAESRSGSVREGKEDGNAAGSDSISREALRDTLVALLRSDDAFLDTIHREYLRRTA